MMKTLLTLVCLGWISTALAAEPVAIVCFVAGAPTEKAASGPRSLALYDRLGEGAELEVDAAGKLVIAYFDGQRFELGAKAKARVGAAALENAKGSVKSLPPVAVMPDVAPIAKQDRASGRAGAIRVRGSGSQVSDLEPANGRTVLADRLHLRFQAVAGIDRYRVEIEDEEAASVLSVETRTNDIEISPGVLTPGKAYFWQVRSLGGASGFGPRGEAMFVTIGEREAQIHHQIVAQAASASDPALWVLAARYDRGVGLVDESCRSLGQARSLAAGNPPIVALAEEWGCGK